MAQLNVPLRSAEISQESLRILANTEQFYEQWVTLRRLRLELPKKIFWKQVAGRDYLYVQMVGEREPKSNGPRTPDTERRHTSDNAAIDDVEDKLKGVEASLAECLALHKALRLPRLLALPGEILREFDLRGWLGVSLLVVGTNAFAAYEIEAGQRFAAGLDETEDFDLTWLGRPDVMLKGGVRQPLLAALRSVDASFALNPRKPYQALNRKGYEVELLAAPSVMPSLHALGDFNPVPRLEQEWLLQGRPVRHVISDYAGAPVPLVVPDPRWMGLHKLWLSNKPERDPLKKSKDAKQGDLLLRAVADRMASRYPMDTDFVLDLPAELLPVFNHWAKAHDFMPAKPALSWTALRGRG